MLLGISMTLTVSARKANSGKTSGRIFGDVLKNVSLKIVLLFIGIKRQIADFGFDQILEEMRPEGKVGQIVSFFPGDFDEHGRIRDIGIGDLHAQLDIPPASPASGSHEDEPTPRQELIEFSDGPSDGQQRWLHL